MCIQTPWNEIIKKVYDQYKFLEVQQNLMALLSMKEISITSSKLLAWIPWQELCLHSWSSKLILHPSKIIRTKSLRLSNIEETLVSSDLIRDQLPLQEDWCVISSSEWMTWAHTRNASMQCCNLMMVIWPTSPKVLEAPLCAETGLSVETVNSFLRHYQKSNGNSNARASICIKDSIEMSDLQRTEGLHMFFLGMCVHTNILIFFWLHSCRFHPLMFDFSAPLSVWNETKWDWTNGHTRKDAFAAVTVPWGFTKAGFNLAICSGLETRIPLSAVTVCVRPKTKRK